MATKKTMTLDELKTAVEKAKQEWVTEQAILQQKKDLFIEQQFKEYALHINYLILSNKQLQALLQQQQQQQQDTTSLNKATPDPTLTEEQKTSTP